MSLDDALKLVSSKRPIISPNHGFLTQLKQYATEIYCSPVASGGNLRVIEESKS